MRFNPPPNWPPPPTPDWTPPAGWQPDPTWGPPPPGWVLWVDDNVPPARAVAPRDQRAWYKKKRFLIPIGVVGLLIVIGIFAPAPDPETTAAVTGTPTANESVATTTTPPAEQSKLAETTAPTTPAPTPAPPKTKTLTSGQRNALEKAEEYLEYQAFSRKGLIEQLKFEGFTTTEATYAVDHVTVDWNDQAVKQAKQYLEQQSFSRSGLIDQLEFEGFTPSQARHGVAAAY